MTFREITWDSDEYRQTLQLREQVLRIPIGLALSPDDIADEDAQFHFTIVEGAALFGCVVAKPLDRGVVKLRQMAVSPLRQRAGIGRQLIAHVENVLRERGFQHIELSARETALGFYEKLGYRSQGEFYSEQGIAHIRMLKQLRKSLP